MRDDGPLRRPLGWIKERAPKVHHFLTRDDSPYHGIREAIGFGLVVILLAVSLWGATGQSFPDAPIVVIESGSMMHCDQGPTGDAAACEGPYARLGTIDAGDLVFVRDVEPESRVVPYAASLRDEACAQAGYLDCACDGVERYGACGDVIIFRPGGSTQTTPIIHRALFWIDIHDDGSDECSVPSLDINRVQLLDQRAMRGMGIDASYCRDLHQRGATAEDSGWVTRGDNNNGPDQTSTSGIGITPVQPEWLLGKARGELPWVGLIKLFVSDVFGPTENYSRAPGDVKVMMWLTLGIIVAGPVAVEKILKRRRGQ